MRSDRGDLVVNLFSPKRQYKIPIYQRRYVWNESNWSALWTNIKEKFDCRRSGKEPFSRHFTGTLLTYQDGSKENLLPTYQILDGQQRLITFQIILCVIRDICQLKSHAIKSQSRARFPDSLIKYKESNREDIKLCPKEGLDEKTFRALVAPEQAREKLSEDHLIYRAYEYFKDEIEGYVKEDITDIDLLYDAILLDFDMVQINLKDRGDLEKIFASLNATGRMLDEFDRLRMDLFLRAGRNEDYLYRKYWHHFDTDSYWQDPKNLDDFFRCFLEATVDPTCFQNQEEREVKAFDVYLKQYHPTLEVDQDIEYEFHKLKRYSKVYQEMNDPDSKIGSRIEFYKEFEIENLFSFILFIISEFSNIPLSDDKPKSELTIAENESKYNVAISCTDLELIFDILESYIMRRMLRWGRDHNYKNVDIVNNFLNSLKHERSFSLAKFIKHLTNPDLTRHQDKWSTDSEVNGALTQEWHDHITKGMRYILYCIEVEMKEKKTEIDFTEELRLEYIMPKRWESNLSWQLPLEEGSDRCIPYENMFSEEHKKNNRSWRKVDPSEEGLIDESYLYALNLAKKRRKHQNSIGNLTLVDVDIDTDEFAEKKVYLEDFNLAINKVIYDSESWDAPQIEKRSRDLIKCFHKLWPSSEHFKKEYLSRKYPMGSTVRGTVEAIRNNGILLQLEEGIEGWIPVSEAGWEIVKSLDSEIEAIVQGISGNKRAMRLILSRKPFQLDLYDHLKRKYPIGTKITSQILKVTNSGAFVEIDGGIRGRIQESDLSWANRYIIANEILKEGDEVETVVLSISADTQYISLGLKQLQPNPWETLEQRYPIGTKITGQIVNLTEFGAFVEIEEGISGLLHNTELSWTKNNVTAHECFAEGDEVEVIVSKIEADKQYISVSLKQLQPSPWDQVPVLQKYPVGMKVTGQIRRIVSFGAFAEIEEGIKGLLHNTELSWTKDNVTAHECFAEGDEVEVIVSKIEADKQYISVSLKQLQPSPWDQVPVLQKYPVGMKVTGQIRRIVSFGAFAEIEEGIKGLLHNTELSWTKDNVTASKCFAEGDEVEVVILEVDVSKRQMLLSHKQTKPDPWSEVSEKYKVGSIVRGQIVNLTEFGAFVEIEEGIEGLIHISELTDREIEKPEEMVCIGEELEVKVINVSLEDRRIGLSLKAMIANGSKVTPQWVSMVESQTIIFTTYRGRKQLSQIKVCENEVIGLSNKNKKLKFNVKEEILFAYSLEAFQYLRDHIPRSGSVETHKTEEFKIEDTTLKSAEGIHVKATTRSAHELQGIIEGFDEDAIYMKIKKQKVIVFRHGLCALITDQE